MSDTNWPKSDLLEAAWGIIANASEGNWSAQTPEWQEAATRWRNAYHEKLAKREPQPVRPPASRDFA